jgi:hypothetical protein
MIFIAFMIFKIFSLFKQPIRILGKVESVRPFLNFVVIFIFSYKLLSFPCELVLHFVCQQGVFSFMTVDKQWV